MSLVKIVYVDDEIHQQIALESILPDEWELHFFSNPLEAIEKVVDINPALVISDQRMPGMQGFKFLETIKTLVPNAVRIITTGYNDENSIVESIRKAQVFDYIIKPWDIDKLMSALDRAVLFYQTETERRSLSSELLEKNKELSETCVQLEDAVQQHQNLESELKCWVHPFVMKAAEENLEFPMKKDLGILVMDIIESSKLHGLQIGQTPARVKVLQTAWEIVLKHGGEVESQEGDKIYANFGLTENNSFHPANAAFAAAKELRSALQAINDHYTTKVECGIAVHFAPACEVYLRETALNSPAGIKIRKKFDTSSSHIDLAHRMENLTHFLPGGNIILTRSLEEKLQGTHDQKMFHSIGHHVLKGQTQPEELLLIKSSVINDADIQSLIEHIEKSLPSAS